VEQHGCGLDALWNDDWHHSAMVALTGRAEGYYSDTHGTPQELISAAKYGALFQGQYYDWQRDRRGAPGWGIDHRQWVVFLQNHDQVANSARGLRGHQLASPARWRALTALLLLGPNTPLLFQGQEFNASSPFLYFADCQEPLAQAVRRGRAEFLTQFPSVADFENRAALDDPASPSTFKRSIVDWTERHVHTAAYALHQDLLRLRRDDPVFRRQGRDGIDGAVLAPHAFVLRFFSPDHTDDRLLVVNLGPDVKRPSYAEPLVAPPPGRGWSLTWTSEDPKYGGSGTPAFQMGARWWIPSDSAIVFTPCPAVEQAPTRKVRRRSA
jgi:maltooligosyltrehalose trehalohydrolase